MMRDGVFVGGYYIKNSSKCATFAWSLVYKKYYYVKPSRLENTSLSGDQGTCGMALVSPVILAFWSDEE